MNRQSYSLTTSIEQLASIHTSFNYSASYVGDTLTRKHSQYQSVHGFGARKLFKEKAGRSFAIFQQSLNNTPDWHFCCLGYDLKNETEHLKSENEDRFQLPDLFVFVPRFVITQQNDAFTLFCSRNDYSEFCTLLENSHHSVRNTPPISLKPTISKQQYLERFAIIQEEISYGNVYEMNFCQEFIQQNALISPVNTFLKIHKKAPAPFMAFMKMNETFLISASPERYLLKKGNHLLSQPIKGTAKRGQTAEEDKTIQTDLQNNLKERTENVMIVDLVRNDLGKCCEPGSVNVSELHELYSFPTVHQLISTIEGKVKKEMSVTDIFRRTFPMGSMTGAPKLQVLKLTEQLEEFKRGWYSGSVGYIDPDQNFDLNVVIRSLIYHKSKQLLSYGVGGGITASSIGVNEYEECLLKVNSLVNLLNEEQNE